VADTEPATAALVVLVFETPAKAEQFAQLAAVQLPDSVAPFVLHGTAYEYVREETGERGQVIEISPASRFDVFVGPQGPLHHVLQRITVEADHAERTGGSIDHDGPGEGAGEGGGVPA
jgi:hypothetical protein